MPRLSVITVNFNNRSGLKKTMASVFSQTFKNLEYIVIDGGSTDGSAEEIPPFAGRLAYWVSEPDKGIYHAMNKGIQKATGDYCLFMNSGDCLVDNQVLERTFALEPEEDLIYTDVIIGRHINRYPAQLDMTFFLTRSLCHQSTLLKRKLFETCGPYREDLKISSDWEFILRMILINHCSYRYLSSVILARIEMGGISLSKKHIERHNQERDAVLRDHLMNILAAKSQDEKGKQEILDVFIRYSHVKESALVKLAQKFETTHLFFLLRNLYHRMIR